MDFRLSLTKFRLKYSIILGISLLDFFFFRKYDETALHPGCTPGQQQKGNIMKTKSVSVSMSAGTIAGLAILTAIVVVLQLVGSQIRLGPFSISLVLIPIVVGASLYGPLAGGWLGLVFSAIVMVMDTAAFMAISPFGTVVTVMLKGTLAGLVSGFVYQAVHKRSLGVLLSAFVCPMVNTGIFLLGCVVFFLPTIREWGVAAGYDNVVAFMLLGMIGLNFLVELGINLVLSPAILRIIHLARSRR